MSLVSTILDAKTICLNNFSLVSLSLTFAPCSACLSKESESESEEGSDSEESEESGSDGIGKGDPRHLDLLLFLSF